MNLTKPTITQKKLEEEKHKERKKKNMGVDTVVQMSNANKLDHIHLNVFLDTVLF
jgi:thiamine biosynthesis protein ThiC